MAVHSHQGRKGRDGGFRAGPIKLKERPQNLLSFTAFPISAIFTPFTQGESPWKLHGAAGTVLEHF